MSLRTDSEANPYAPPASEVGVVGDASPTDMKRPTSLKWIIFTFGMGSLVVVRMYFVAITKYGFATVWKGEPLFDPIFLNFIAFFVSMMRARARWRYFLLCAILGYMVVTTWWKIHQGRLPGFTRYDGLVTTDNAGVVTVCLLMTWLFYRLAFGRPSRTYFKLLPSTAESSESLP